MTADDLHVDDFTSTMRLNVLKAQARRMLCEFQLAGMVKVLNEQSEPEGYAEKFDHVFRTTSERCQTLLPLQ
jgi:hypothetical protein